MIGLTPLGWYPLGYYEPAAVPAPPVVPPLLVAGGLIIGRRRRGRGYGREIPNVRLDIVQDEQAVQAAEFASSERQRIRIQNQAAIIAILAAIEDD